MKRKYIATVHIEIWTDYERQEISDMQAKEILGDISDTMKAENVPHDVESLEEITRIDTRRIPCAI